MLTYTFRNTLAIGVVLTIVFGVLGIKSANAIVFEFIATCEFCTSPLVPNSPVTGELTLNDSILVGGAILPAGPIFTTDIISLTLNFVTTIAPDFLLEYDFGPSFEPLPGVTEPVGAFNAGGTGIAFIAFTDFTSDPTQFFVVGTFLEGQPANWVLAGVPDGGGTVTSFDPPKAPEPNSTLLFMLAIAYLGFHTHRRPRRKAVAR